MLFFIPYKKSEHRGLQDFKCTIALNDHFPTSDEFASNGLLARAVRVMGMEIPCLRNSQESSTPPTKSICE